MTTMQLQEYAKERRAAGLTIDAIRAELAAAGWADADIRTALGEPGIPSAQVASPVRRKRWPWLLLPVLLLLGGGTAAAYLAFFAVSPDRVLGEALYRAMWADTSEFAGSLHVKVAPDPESEQGAKAEQTLQLFGTAADPDQPIEMFLDFDAAYDHRKPDDMKSRSAYGLAVVEGTAKKPVGALETRRVGGITYLSLTRPPEIPFLDLSSLTGTWITFDPKALAGMFGSPTAEAEEVEDAPTGKPTAEQREAISQAFAELRPITVAETFKDEPAAGALSRHYRLAVDKEKLRAFMLRLKDIMKDDDSSIYGKIDEDFDQFAEQVTVSGFEIWIGKESGLPTRLLLSLDVTSSKDVPGKGMVSLDMTFKSFDQPVAIAAPAGAKSIQEIIGQLMGDFLATEGDMTGLMDAESATATIPN